MLGWNRIVDHKPNKPLHTSLYVLAMPIGVKSLENVIVCDGIAGDDKLRVQEDLRSVAECLQKLERIDIVHGNLIPSNVMLFEEQQDSGSKKKQTIKLIDLGEARATGTSARHERHTDVGAHSTLPPELAQLALEYRRIIHVAGVEGDSENAVDASQSKLKEVFNKFGTCVVAKVWQTVRGDGRDKNWALVVMADAASAQNVLRQTTLVQKELHRAQSSSSVCEPSVSASATLNCKKLQDS